MIRGGDPNNMRFGDTLSEDQFSGYQFQYIISIIWTPFSISTLVLQPRSTQSSALDRMVALIALF